MLRCSNAAIYCRRSHLSDSENPAEGLPLAGNGCIPISCLLCKWISLRVIATLWQKMSVKIEWNLKQVIIWMSRSESHSFRQSKPKSNTKVFGLGFSFAKIQVLSAFFDCRLAVIAVFLGFVWVCSYRFVRSSCRRFYAAKAKKREWAEIGFAWFFDVFRE